MAAQPSTLQSGRPVTGNRRLPKWAPVAGVGLAALAYVVYRRSKSSLGSAANNSAAGSSSSLPYGNATTMGGGFGAPGYGAPGPVSVLPPLTVGGTSSTDTTQQVPPPVTAFPPGGFGGTNPAPSLPVQQGTPTPPTPQPVQPANLPADLVARIQANGEQLIGNMIDPQTGGTWWFGSKGGVFAVNGARFLGSVGSSNAYFPGLNIIAAQPSGNGYRLIGSKGENYNYPGQ